MLTYRTTSKVPIPHEEGEWIEIRPLSWKAIEEAKHARLKGLIETMQDAAPLLQLLEGRTVDTQDAGLVDPLAQYDLTTLLLRGIVGWSYGEVIDKENIEALDELTAKWAAEMLLGAGRGNEADRKNASSNSTKRSMGEPSAHPTNG